MFSRQCPIKRTNSHGHTTITAGSNLFGPKSSNPPQKKTPPLIAANYFSTTFQRRFDSHDGGIRTIREVLNNECKQDLQAKIDEANGDETPLPAKFLKLLEIFPRSGLKTN